MNLAHLHLLLNHFPTIGTVIGLGLFLVALVGKNDDLKRAGLGVFFVIALLALPAYMTGNAAQAAITGRPDVSEALIEAHQQAALLAFVFMEITGAVSWLGLWQFRRISRLASWNLSAVLLLSIVTVGLMTNAGNRGGEIRHPEIVPGEETASAEAAVSSGMEWLRGPSIGAFVLDHRWVWPASEALHFIGLCLLFGIVLLVNLRMLGMMKKLPFAALHRLLPWAILGLGINSVTGMLFFISTPEQYTQNVAFHWKMALMMLAGVNVLYLTLFDEAWALGPGDDAPLRGKVMAASALILWFGVTYCGRMLPFIGNSF